MENGETNNLTGWSNGDFDYSGVVDDNDEALLENTESYALAAPLPPAAENQLYSFTLPGDAIEANTEISTIQNWLIRWGDGSSTNYAVPAGSSPDVLASHTYATPNVGGYAVSIIASGSGGYGSRSHIYTLVLPHEDVVVAPDAPTNQFATESIAGEVDLDWNDDSQVLTGYTVTATPVGSGATVTQNLPADAISAAIVGLTPGQSYNISVVATNTLSDGITAASQPATLPATAPAASLSVTGPTIVDEGGSGNTLNLSSGAGSGIVNWTVNWYDNNGNVITTDTVNGASGTDAYPVATTAGLTAVVTAYDGEGNSFNLPPLIINVMPLPPSNPQAIVISANEVDLTWNNTSAFGQEFNILRSVDGGPFSLVDTVSGTSYQDTSAPPAEAVTYEVQAVADAGAAASSAATTSTVNTPSQAIIFNPVVINYFDVGAISGVVTLSWSYQGKLDTFWEVELEDTSRPGTNYADVNPNVGSLGAGQFTTTFGGLDPDDNYNVRVRCQYADGTDSAYATTAFSFTPTVFATLSAEPMSSDGDNFIQLSWTFADPEDHDVRIEYQGTPTAGLGWCAIDATDVPYSDNGQFTGTDPYIDYSIGDGQSARFRISIGGVNGAGWTYSTEVTQGGAAGPAPAVSLQLNADGSVTASWPDDSDASYATTVGGQSFGSALGASDFYIVDTTNPATFSTTSGSHVYISVEETTFDPSTGDELIGYGKADMIIPGQPAPAAPTVRSSVQLGPTTDAPPISPDSSPGQNIVHLTWTNPSNNESNYTIERESLSSGQPLVWTDLGTVGSDSTRFDDYAVVPGTYEYRITAINSAGSASTTITVQVWAPGYEISFDGTLQNHNKSAIDNFNKDYSPTGSWGYSSISNPKDYVAGVGPVQLTGSQMVDAVATEYSNIVGFYQNAWNRAHVPIDIVGWSRGCFEALLLANLINTYGIPDLSSMHKVIIPPSYPKGHSLTQVVYSYFKGPDAPKIRFMGLLSPVGQTSIFSELASLFSYVVTLSFGIIHIDPGWSTDCSRQCLGHLGRAR